MTLVLTMEKLTKITGQCQDLSSQPQTTVLLALAKLIGLLSSTTQAVPPARYANTIFTRGTDCSNSTKRFIPGNISLAVTSQRRTPLVECESKTSQWQVSIVERTEYWLFKLMLQWMLMAVRHAILTSAKTKSNTSIYLQMDNKTAPSYVWKIREGGWGKWGGGGGTHNKYLLDISKSIWPYLFPKADHDYCQISSQHLEHKRDCDWVSRHAMDKFKWKYHLPIFQKILLHMGTKKNRSFWMKELSSSSPIYSLETGSQEHRGRSNTAPMGKWVRLCVSFIPLGQPCFEQGPAREGRSFDHSDAKVAKPALVFSAFNDVYTETITASANRKSVGKPTRPTARFSR